MLCCNLEVVVNWRFLCNSVEVISPPTQVVPPLHRRPFHRVYTDILTYNGGCGCLGPCGSRPSQAVIQASYDPKLSSRDETKPPFLAVKKLKNRRQ